MQRVEANPQGRSQSVKTSSQVTEARIGAVRTQVDEVSAVGVQLERGADLSGHQRRVAAAN